MRAARVRAVVTIGGVASLRPAEMLRMAAVESHGPRFILAFGSRLPAGVIALDSALIRSADAGERALSGIGDEPCPAILTADLRPDGVSLYRHEQEGLVAAALHLVLRSGMASGETVLSTLAPMSHAALVSGLVSTLLIGGALHVQPLFSGDGLLRQIEASGCPHLVVPGPLEAALAQTGLLGSVAVSSTQLVHRAPVRLDRVEAVPGKQTPIVDLLALGERGLLAGRRGGDGRPSLGLGEARIPEDDGDLIIGLRENGSGVLETAGAAVAHCVGQDLVLNDEEWVELGLHARLNSKGQIASLTRTA
jgi:hypothetical protein